MSSGMWFHTLDQARQKSFLDDPLAVDQFVELERALGGPKASFGFNDEWHAMTFLLTDVPTCTAVPAGNGPNSTAFCFAGELLEGAPFDGCCLLSSIHARHAAVGLQALKMEGFRQRFDSASFQGADEESIYRLNYWKDSAHFDELALAFAGFQAFFSGTAKRDEGVMYYWV